MDKFAEVIEKSLEASADAYKAQQAIIEQQETDIHKLDGELFEARSDAKVYRECLDKLIRLGKCHHLSTYNDAMLHEALAECERMLEERDKEACDQ